MPQINDIRELAQQNARYVSNSPQDWMSYLDVAARLYRYSFTDTLLIHAQRPDATACAEMELWNQKMSRWEDVSNRIHELLRQGEYAPQAVLDAARQNALQEHAQTLRRMEISLCRRL